MNSETLAWISANFCELHRMRDALIYETSNPQIKNINFMRFALLIVQIAGIQTESTTPTEQDYLDVEADALLHDQEIDSYSD